MIDFHTHSLLSDGELLPSELVRRAVVKGYQALAITDHVDVSNIDWVIPRLVKDCDDLKRYFQIKVIPGAELTHVPPARIKSLAEEARKLGAKIVVVHGETIVEPVAPDSNLRALESPIDILAHPGLITEEEVKLAKRNGIMLEITARKGHCLTNGHVAKLALKTGAGLVLNTDAHSPEDLITPDQARQIALGAGLGEDDFAQLRMNAQELLKKKIV
ncbi:MAG: histidinol phosphate phosphatase domain-containing protein [Deltaproteobacteria bacterium]|nr:histidinol phosphate phosphatase domain-containing protein [Deltaproteobacteria bacterium]